MTTKNICWIVTEGSLGMENQALGLGEAMDYSCVVKRIKLRKPWLFFTPYLSFAKKYCLSKEGDILSNPWPELIIACGRKSILPSLYVKEASLGRTQLIYLQNPKISTKHFDLVICPIHDNLSGNNVIKMVGAPHQVTEEKLRESIPIFKDNF